MIKVIVAGAAGRMGARLVSLLKESAALTLVGAVESKGHLTVGEDAGEVAGARHIGLVIPGVLSARLATGGGLVEFFPPRPAPHAPPAPGPQPRPAVRQTAL